MYRSAVVVLVLLQTLVLVSGFLSPSSVIAAVGPSVRPTSPLFAKKKPKKKTGAAGSGGGFGASKPSDKQASKSIAVAADKSSLEKQWDNFVAITDLEICPKTDEENFEVADVFVRAGTTPWFRIGKVCAEGDCSIEAALTIQKGLIFFSAVHLRRELVAAGGKSGAASLEVGFTESSMTVGSESDGPIEEEEDGLEITVASKASVKDVGSNKCFGFRPDWNPPGFTYKRREKAAAKKNKKKGSTLDEIASI